MYGLTIFFALILCLFLLEKKLKPELKPILWKLSFFMILGGVIGARIYHVIHLFDYYKADPSKIFIIQNGGLGIFGGIIGAVSAFLLVAYWETYRKNKKSQKIDILFWTDNFAFFAPLAQSIGRWANYFNKELLPFAIYESFFSLFVFLGFLAVNYRKPKIFKGFYSGAYLISYGLIRIILEQFKTDQWKLFNFYTAHLFSVLFIFIGLILLNRTKNAKK